MADAPDQTTGEPWKRFDRQAADPAGKPWEKYQAAAPSAAPWERFKAPEAQAKPWERFANQEPAKPAAREQGAIDPDAPLRPLLDGKYWTEPGLGGRLKETAKETWQFANPFSDKNQGAAHELWKQDADFRKDVGAKLDELAARGATRKEVSDYISSTLKDPRGGASKEIASNLAVGFAGGGLAREKVGEALEGKKPAAPDAAAQPAQPAPAAAPAKRTGLVEAPAPGSPLSEKPAVTRPPRYEDQLFQLEGNSTADSIEARQKLAKLPDGIKPETWEKLYHYRESELVRPKAGAPEAVALTAEEKALYDTHVKPVLEENQRYYQALKGLGEAIDRPPAPGHLTRKVAGKTWSFGEMVDRAVKRLEEVKMGGAGTRSMRKTTDSSSNRRKVYLATNDAGQSRVVYVGGDRNVLPFDETRGGHFDLGELGKVKGKVAQGSKFSDKAGSTWHLEEATTKEIEAASNIRYSKNILANELDENVKLKSAYRNAMFVKQSISEMEQNGLALKRNETPVPPRDAKGRPYRTPTIAQFQNYLVEPRIADALDRFKTDRHSDPATLAANLHQAGKVMNWMMFLNPLAHLNNVFNHMMVEGGLVGNVVGAPSLARNLVKATKAVTNGDADYIRAVRAGASLPYSKMLSADLHDMLIKKLGGEMERDQGTWNKMAEAAGLPNAKALFSRISTAPQKALWLGSDIMTYAKLLQNAEKLGSFEKSIRKTEEHMPNYRVPAQVMGQRWLAELFGNPAVGRFGRYQYGRTASYFRMMRDAFGPDRTLGQRAHSFDQMLMLGVYLYLLYPAFDYAWQQATGNKDTKVIRSGAASVPQAIMDAADGDKNFGDLSQSLYTLGAPVELPIELYEGKYLWSGQPIIRDADVRAGRVGEVAGDALRYVGSKASSVGQIGDRLAGGKKTWEQLGLEAIGVKEPDPGAADKRAYYKRKAEQDALRRSMRE